MGKEIQSTLSEENTAEFFHRLTEETGQVLAWGKNKRFAPFVPRVGLEIEACLVDEGFHAVPINEKFLKSLNNPHATIELARFNVEFNPPPLALSKNILAELREQLGDLYARANDTAEKLDVRLLLVGILPTLMPGDLDANTMSKSNRFRHFAKTFGRWQKGRPTRVDIPENKGLVVSVNSVIMESVTTSMQIHLQVPEPGSAAYYNASQILAAPMLAACANSPFFMGRDLWAETRVPVFEQVLAARFEAAGHLPSQRDNFFGYAYVENSALEIFTRNRDHLAVVLPELFDDARHLPHLSLHNGTIWRWVRPVLSFDSKHRPILRLEFRAIPSGPTIRDMSAQTAFFTGAVHGLAEKLAGISGGVLEKKLPFAAIRQNFYHCAQQGLTAQVKWLDGKTHPVDQLILNKLLPLAKTALKKLDIDPHDIAVDLDLIRQRVTSGQTGAVWQRAHMQRSGGGSPGVAKMTAAYYRRQLQNTPVHTWSA